MKIAIVTSYAPSALNFRASLIESLVAKGCNVAILAPNYSPSTRSAIENLGATAVSFPMERTGVSPLSDLHSFWFLRKFFCEYKPDVVLTYFAKPNIWGILASFLAGVPWRVAMVEGLGFVFTLNTAGRRSVKQKILGYFILRLYRLSFMVANKIIVLNPDDLHELSVMCRLDCRKIFLLGGIGVLLDEWKPPESTSLSPLSFIMVARLLREKGVFEFLNAARTIKEEYPHIRFLLLGGLDENPGAICKDELGPWLIDGCVEFLGHVDVKSWLARSSVFVLPSYREGVPLSTQEAMAMGLPIITTDVPGCRETVIDGVNGFIVPPRDSLKLAEAMKQFISTPSLIGLMGRESRRLAEERFDVRIANIKIMSVLHL